LQTDLVLLLLLVDESNPRSVGFQLAALLHQMNRVQESEQSNSESVEHRLVSKATTLVRSSRTADLSRRDTEGNFGAVEELANELTSTLWELSDALTARYFSNLTACRLTSSW